MFVSETTYFPENEVKLDLRGRPSTTTWQAQGLNVGPRVWLDLSLTEAVLFLMGLFRLLFVPFSLSQNQSVSISQKFNQKLTPSLFVCTTKMWGGQCLHFCGAVLWTLVSLHYLYCHKIHRAPILRRQKPHQKNKELQHKDPSDSIKQQTSLFLVTNSNESELRVSVCIAPARSWFSSRTTYLVLKIARCYQTVSTLIWRLPADNPGFSHSAFFILETSLMDRPSFCCRQQENARLCLRRNEWCFCLCFLPEQGQHSLNESRWSPNCDKMFFCSCRTHPSSTAAAQIVTHCLPSCLYRPAFLLLFAVLGPLHKILQSFTGCNHLFLLTSKSHFFVENKRTILK